MKYYQRYNFHTYTFYIIEENHYIVGITFEQPNASFENTPLISLARQQLDEYFAGKRQKFSLPIKMQGTEFQLKVWQALQEIPYGQTRSYKDIAVAIQCHKAYRAVGLANHQNKLAIIIPCHRVIGTNGHLVGYAGGCQLKKCLLNLEQRFR